MAIDDTLSTQVRDWVAIDPDAETAAEVQALLDAAESGDAKAAKTLASAFAGRLEFGTAGLRAELGAGTARMNRVVVSQTSAGFAAYLLDRARSGETASPPTVIVGYDGRVNSERFAHDTAEIMAGAGIEVTLLPGPLPTPVTAFAVKHLGVSAGVMITASHNPPRDNGYKVFLGDADAGSQIVSPTDLQITAHIVRSVQEPFDSLPRSQNYSVANDSVCEAYVEQVAQAVCAETSLDTEVELKIVYTAMHGVGADTARRVFERAGLPPLIAVDEQNEPNGEFPTVAFPNPEEPGALELAIRKANEVSAELIVAHDPDADRLAIALPDPKSEGGYRRLTGNELGLLLGWRAAEREKTRAAAAGEAPHGTLANTIVSSPALGAVARDYELDYVETLSGFKWVSRVPDLIFGFEEAIGYLTHPEVVRDKDGILASADAIAMAQECKQAGKTLWQLLDEASMRFGHFASAQIVVRLDSIAEVVALAEWIRGAPPQEFGGVQVQSVRDLMLPGASDVPANVLSYDLVDGSRVMIRPSGTEPKLKIYLDAFSDQGSLSERRAAAEAALDTIETALRSYLAGAPVHT